LLVHLDIIHRSFSKVKVIHFKLLGIQNPKGSITPIIVLLSRNNLGQDVHTRASMTTVKVCWYSMGLVGFAVYHYSVVFRMLHLISGANSPFLWIPLLW